MSAISDIDSEKYVIGSILQRHELYSILKDAGICDDWFFTPDGRNSWLGIEYLHNNRMPIEPASLMEYLRNKDSKTNPNWCLDCIDTAISALNAPHYADILKNKYLKRELRTIFCEANSRLQSESSAYEIASEVKCRLSDMNLTKKRNISVKDIAANRARLYKEAKETGCIGIPSRWDKVQEWLGGYLPGKMHVLAARPSLGKTMFLCNEAYNAALLGYKVGFISLEMSEDEIRTRLAADELGIDLHEYEQGDINTDQIAELENTIIRQAELPILINDTSKNIYDINSWIMDNTFDLVGIDYIQIIRRHHRDPTGTVDRLSMYSNEIVNTASLSKAAIILLSQLKRSDSSKGEDAKIEPELSDLKGTGSLEQDAEKVIFLYQNPKDKGDGINEMESIAKIAKHRGGRTGKGYLTFKKCEGSFQEKRGRFS